MTAPWQPTDKEAAIISLLGVALVYEGRMPMALKSQRYAASTQEPGPPPPAWTYLDCDGRCLWTEATYPCEWDGKCRGELWQVEKEKLARRYRINAVMRSLAALEQAMHEAYVAVWALYVDPYDAATEPLDGWHKQRRMDWARKGIEFMAAEIPGEVVAFGEKRSEKLYQIAHMLRAGHTWKRIAAEVQVSRREINAVKKEMVEA